MTAEIITIGNELLFGHVVDTNAAWISQNLSAAGFRVIRRMTVGDEPKEMEEAIRSASARVRVVIATGGLGPTDDDITRHAIAKAFGTELVFHKETEDRLRAFFRKIDRPFADCNLIQAWFPEGAEIVPNSTGTAPGICMRTASACFYALPGVPSEMKTMMEKTVLPQLRKLTGVNAFIHRTLRTTGIGESALFEILKNSLEKGPVQVAYLPDATGVKIRLSCIDDNPEKARLNIIRLEKQITALLDPYIYGYDDTSLEEAVGALLSEKKMTLCVAESCTGGLLGATLTKVSGSSAYFFGGWITYDNRAKTDELGMDNTIISSFGAVSRETVEAMAVHARKKAQTDFALTISGIAGPDGGTAEKPVGLIWIGLAMNGKVISEKSIFGQDRESNRTRAVSRALYMLFNELKKYKKESSHERTGKE